MLPLVFDSDADKTKISADVLPWTFCGHALNTVSCWGGAYAYASRLPLNVE